MDENIISGNSIFEKDFDLPKTHSMFCTNPINLLCPEEGFGYLEKDPSLGIFDVVIGNPPYINVYKLNKTDGAVNYLKNKFPIAAHKKTEFYCIFLKRSIQLLKPDGLVSLITPDKWYYEPYGESLREEILKKHSIDSLTIVGEEIFKSTFRKSPMVPASITTIRKGKKLESIIHHEDFRLNYREHFANNREETGRN